VGVDELIQQEEQDSAHRGAGDECVEIGVWIPLVCRAAVSAQKNLPGPRESRIGQNYRRVTENGGVYTIAWLFREHIRLSVRSKLRPNLWRSMPRGTS